MKKIVFVLLLAALLPLSAQKNYVNIGVIPSPQRVEMGQGTLTATRFTPRRNFVEHIEGAQNQQQAYRLDITPDGVVVTCVANEGWGYALKTLDQLKKLYPAGIPCMTITDWPAYEYRGWLDDISRGPIPNRQFRRQTRSFSERYKLNFGNYYTEHTLYNEQYPDISGNSGLSSFEYSDDPFMMANLQCFAHFEKTLRIPYYQSIMDGPTNVNPAREETYTFLRNQIENAVDAYHSSRFFNINCDETEGLGSGRAKQYVEQIGADEVYVQHINRVYNIVQQAYREAHNDGRRMEVLMWGDIVAKNPAMLRQLPKDMQYIVWSYGASDSYANMIEPFARLHREQGNAFWVAPSVSHASGAPSVRNYIENIAFLARDGYLAGARGLMNTSWDDSGEGLFADGWHAMAWAAEMAWRPLKSTNPKEAKRELAERERIFNQNYDRLFEIEYRKLDPEASGNPSVTRMLNTVGALNGNRWVGDWCNTVALMQPLMEFNPIDVSNDMLKRCDSVEAIVRRALAVVDSNRLPHYAYTCHRVLCVAEKSRLRIQLYRALMQDDSASAAKYDIQAASRRYFLHLHNLKLEYLRLWDEENTDYSRDIVCERFDRLGREVQELRQKVFITNDYRDGKMYVSLRSIFKDRPIYFTVDGRKPTQGANLYRRPFTIGRSCIVRAVTYSKWDEPVYSDQYLLFHKAIGKMKKLNSRYSDYQAKYSGGGDNALADGVMGSDETYTDGHWQGYWGKDIDVSLDLGSSTAVKSITMRFFHNANDWILTPKTIEVYTSSDGTSWKLAHTEQFNPDFRDRGGFVRTNTIRNLKLNTRHLRVVAKNPGPLPEWHLAKGSDSWLFCDEVIVE